MPAGGRREGGQCSGWRSLPLLPLSLLPSDTCCRTNPACRYEEGKLPTAKVESDTFAFRHVPYSKPSIQVWQLALTCACNRHGAVA